MEFGNVYNIFKGLQSYMKSDSNENNLNILFGESTNGC